MPIGSNFDEFLNDVGILESTTQAARQKLLALQVTTCPSDSSQQNSTPTKDSSDSIQVKLD